MGGNVEEIQVGQMAIRFLVEGHASGGSVAVFEFDLPARAKLPGAHSHDAYEETIYGLEGVVTFTVEGQQTDIGPGEVLCIHRGAAHRFDNGRAVDAKALAIVTPGILSPDYFREVEAVIKAAAGGPPTLAALAEVMRRHGPHVGTLNEPPQARRITVKGSRDHSEIVDREPSWRKDSWRLSV